MASRSTVRRARPGRPTKYTPELRRVLFEAILEGATLKGAADVAGVHLATVCRWQRRRPALRRALWSTVRIRDARRYRAQRRRRPRVPWREDCPKCGAVVVVRCGPYSFIRYWRCEWWPWEFTFVSWRLPGLGSYPDCGGPLFWSHSRSSVGCDACGFRRYQK